MADLISRAIAGQNLTEAETARRARSTAEAALRDASRGGGGASVGPVSPGASKLARRKQVIGSRGWPASSLMALKERGNRSWNCSTSGSAMRPCTLSRRAAQGEVLTRFNEACAPEIGKRSGACSNVRRDHNHDCPRQNSHDYLSCSSSHGNDVNGALLGGYDGLRAPRVHRPLGHDRRIRAALDTAEAHPCLDPSTLRPYA